MPSTSSLKYEDVLDFVKFCTGEAATMTAIAEGDLGAQLLVSSRGTHFVAGRTSALRAVFFGSRWNEFNVPSQNARTPSSFVSIKYEDDLDFVKSCPGEAAAGARNTAACEFSGCCSGTLRRDRL